MRTSAFLFLMMPLCQAAVRADADDASKAILEKAIKAHGGADKVAKLQVARMKTKGSLTFENTTAAFTGDSSHQFPDKGKLTMELEIGSGITVMQVQNGKDAWWKIGAMTEDLKEDKLVEQLTRHHHNHVCTLLPLLRDKEMKVSTVGESKLGDRPVLGIRVAKKGLREINLFFDKESGLLVKSERRGIDLKQKEVAVDTFFRDYKDVQGVKQAMKRVVQHDGQTYLEFHVAELTFESSIDAAEFARP